MNGLIMLTIACPVECEHCQYSCTASKEPWKWMPEETIRRVAEEYSKNGISLIKITGGEPLYDVKKFFVAMDIILNYYKPPNIQIATSGFWATDKKSTEEILLEFKKRKLEKIELSIDRFHLKRVPIKNIENILRISNILGIKIILRPLFDIESEYLIEPIKKLTIKYNTEILFSITDYHGRAEVLDKKFIGPNSTLEKFISSIQSEFQKSKNQTRDIMKMNRMVIPAHPIALTVFPSGNVYSCCIVAKGTFLGNIHKTKLRKLILKFKNSLPGYIEENRLGCFFIKNFLPYRYDDKCDICKSTPFHNIGAIEKEYVGKKFIEMSLKNLSVKRVCEKYDSKHELLLFLRLSANELGKEENGEKIKEFLQKLHIQKIRFKICNALPKCLFGSEWPEVFQKFDIPKNCFECRELFTVEKGFIRYCESLGGIKGYRFDFVKDRNQIYEYFKIERNKLKLPKKCDDCLFRIRNQCNGICF